MDTQTISGPPLRKKPSKGYAPSTPRRSPAEISSLVPMRELLRELGFSSNERTRRGPCLLHGGSNPNVFAWEEDGRWFCFNCGKGGDKFTLIQEARGCTFPESLRFLAVMAGVEVSDPPASRKEVEKRKRERDRIDAASRKLEELERRLRAQYRDDIHDLEALKQNIALRFRQIWAGARERFKEEKKFLWDGVDFAAKYLPRALVAYSILSFSNTEDRARFALRPEERDGMIERVMMAGRVTTDAGRIVEVLV